VALTSLTLLARHGATRANEAGVRIGLADEPLTARGLAQARALAAAMRATSVGGVWTSPLARARQTAEIVARACGLPLYESADLREMDYGPLEGLREDEIARRFPEERRAWSGEPSIAPPGAEPIAAVQARVVRAIERVRESRAALVITHLVPLRLAHAHYGGVPIPLTPGIIRADHCVLHRLSERGLERV
jgi:probable phosphoglycerate mutase